MSVAMRVRWWMYLLCLQLTVNLMIINQSQYKCKGPLHSHHMSDSLYQLGPCILTSHLEAGTSDKVTHCLYFWFKPALQVWSLKVPGRSLHGKCTEGFTVFWKTELLVFRDTSNSAASNYKCVPLWKAYSKSNVVKLFKAVFIDFFRAFGGSRTRCNQNIHMEHREQLPMYRSCRHWAT